MKYLLLATVVFVAILTTPALLSEPEYTEYKRYRPGGRGIDTVAVTPDSTYVESGRQVPDHAWKWMKPIVEKPEF